MNAANATPTRRPVGRPRKYPTPESATARAAAARRAAARCVTLNSKPRYTLEEAAHLLGLGLTKLYERMKEGKIVATRDGVRAFITNDEILRYSGASHD